MALRPAVKFMTLLVGCLLLGTHAFKFSFASSGVKVFSAERFFTSSSLTVLQSYSLTVLQSYSLTVFSDALPSVLRLQVFCLELTSLSFPSRLLVLRSSRLNVSSRLQVFQSSSLTVFQSSSLTVFSDALPSVCSLPLLFGAGSRQSLVFCSPALKHLSDSSARYVFKSSSLQFLYSLDGHLEIA